MSGNTDDVFDDLLEKIADEIYGNEDVKKLGKKLGFNPANIARYNEENTRQGGSHMGTLNMLRKWRQRQKPSEEKKNLKAALENSDFAHFINEYLSADDVEKHPRHTPAAKKRKAEISSKDHAREKGDEKEFKTQHTRPTPAAKTRKVESSHDPECKEDDEEDKPAKKDYTGLEMKKAVPTKEQLDPKKNYEMDDLAKGHLFILNMTKDRRGSAADVENIVHVFDQIKGFEIESHSDLTAKDLKRKLKKFVNSPRNKGMSCAVILLMGHGSKTGIQCTDKEVTTEFISDMVSRMEHMNGKPKIIFFQCCRGNKREKKVETDEAQADIVIPAKSDFLQVYATTEGNVAYRDEDDGSWFIQMLCEELLENAHASDLCTMLEQVTGKVGKMATGENHGQCVVVVKQGISKKIYFLPKYSPKA